MFAPIKDHELCSSIQIFYTVSGNAGNKRPGNIIFPGLYKDLIILVAVRAGFEPAVQFNPYGSLANY